jgi:hypothetical protein
MSTIVLKRLMHSWGLDSQTAVGQVGSHHYLQKSLNDLIDHNDCDLSKAPLWVEG